MYNHKKAQQSKNRVHISWDILYLTRGIIFYNLVKQYKILEDYQCNEKCYFYLVPKIYFAPTQWSGEFQ